MSNFIVGVEEDKSHSVWTEWGKIEGLDAERAVYLKKLCEKIYAAGRYSGISDVIDSAFSLRNTQ